MTWTLTHCGEELDLLNPSADQILVHDLRVALARQPRYNGHTARHYSVAEHSLLVCEIMQRDLAVRSPHALLAGLLHDAHEAYIGDITSPTAAALRALGGGEALEELKRRLDRAMHQRFRLQAAAAAARYVVHHADLIALATERRDLMPHGELLSPWPCLEGIQPAAWINLRDRAGMDEADWMLALSDRIDELQAARAALMHDPVGRTHAGGQAA